MKAISLWQPWASAMAVGLKRNETRHWSTDYRGELAIHAAKKPFSPGHVSQELVLFLWQHRIRFGQFKTIEELFDSLPMGKIVCVLDLKNCVRSEDAINNTTQEEFMLGNYEAGRFAWLTENYRKLDFPVPCVGRQGFFNLPPEVERQVKDQLGRI